MSDAEKVLKVAASQIGYCESPKNSNRTKYGKEFGMNGVAWCAEFLWWCFKHANAGSLFPHNANAAHAQDEVVSKCGGKWVMKKNKSRATRQAYLSKAKPGDIVCFDFGRMDAYRSHIGIVESVSGQYLTVIEGNTSKSGSQSNGGMVVRQRRLYSSVCSAARPKYSGGEPEPFRPLDEDGIFGYETKCRLQRWLGVDEDGIIGKKTVKALQKKIGLTGKAVDGSWGEKTTRKLQEYLTREGFPVTVDGAFGKASITALQQYLNKVVTK